MNLKVINKPDQTLKLSRNLKSLLNSHAISEAELARSLEIPAMTIRRLCSGETTDPRISTLKLIATHFNISVDNLLNDSLGPNHKTGGKPLFIPILEWDVASRVEDPKEIANAETSKWQPITVDVHSDISEYAFVLESRPSMHPRYPVGTVFVIDPELSPTDGDIILLKLGHSELNLKELVIDPPHWHLHSLVSGSEVIKYDRSSDKIIGVVVLTLFYNRKT